MHSNINFYFCFPPFLFLFFPSFMGGSFTKKCIKKDGPLCTWMVQGMESMRQAKEWCHPSSASIVNSAGDIPSSNCLFDAAVSHCIPVILSNDIELPLTAVLDYSEFGIFVHASDAVKKGYLPIFV